MWLDQPPQHTPWKVDSLPPSPRPPLFWPSAAVLMVQGLLHFPSHEFWAPDCGFSFPAAPVLFPTPPLPSTLPGDYLLGKSPSLRFQSPQLTARPGLLPGLGPPGPAPLLSFHLPLCSGQNETVLLSHLRSFRQDRPCHQQPGANTEPFLRACCSRPPQRLEGPSVSAALGAPQAVTAEA